MKFFDLEMSSSMAAKGNRAAYYKKLNNGKCSWELFIHPEPDVPCSANGTYVKELDSNCEKAFKYEYK